MNLRITLVIYQESVGFNLGYILKNRCFCEDSSTAIAVMCVLIIFVFYMIHPVVLYQYIIIKVSQ